MAAYHTLISAANHFIRPAVEQGDPVHVTTFIRVGTNIHRGPRFVSQAAPPDRKSVAVDRFEWARIKVRDVTDTERTPYMLEARAFPSLLAAFHITAEISDGPGPRRVVRYIDMCAAPESPGVVGALLDEEIKYSAAVPRVKRELLHVQKRWEGSAVSLHTILSGTMRSPDGCIWLGDTRDDIISKTVLPTETRVLCACFPWPRGTPGEDGDTGQVKMPDAIRHIEEIMLAPRKMVERWRQHACAAFLCHPEFCRLYTSVIRPVGLTLLIDKEPEDQELRKWLLMHHIVHLPALKPEHIAYDPEAHDLDAAVRICATVAAALLDPEQRTAGCVAIENLDAAHLDILTGHTAVRVVGKSVRGRLLFVIGREGEAHILTLPYIWHKAALALMALHAMAWGLTPIENYLPAKVCRTFDFSAWSVADHMDHFMMPQQLQRDVQSMQTPVFRGVVTQVEHIPDTMCSETLEALMHVHGHSLAPFTLFVGQREGGRDIAEAQMKVCYGAHRHTPHVYLDTRTAAGIERVARGLCGLRAKQLHLHMLDRKIRKQAGQHCIKDVEVVCIPESERVGLHTFAALAALAYTQPLRHVVFSGEPDTCVPLDTLGPPLLDLMRLFPTRTYRFDRHDHSCQEEEHSLWRLRQAIITGDVDRVAKSQTPCATVWDTSDIGIYSDVLTGKHIAPKSLQPFVVRGLEWWGRMASPFPLWICTTFAQARAANILCAELYYTSGDRHLNTKRGAFQSINYVKNKPYAAPPAFVGGIAVVTQETAIAFIHKGQRYHVVDLFVHKACRASVISDWVPWTSKKRAADDDESSGAESSGYVAVPSRAQRVVSVVDALRDTHHVHASLIRASRTAHGEENLRSLPSALFAVLQDMAGNRHIVCEADMFPFERTLVQGDACTPRDAWMLPHTDTVVLLLLGRSAYYTDRPSLYTSAVLAGQRLLVLGDASVVEKAVTAVQETPHGVLSYMIRHAVDQEIYRLWRTEIEQGDVPAEIWEVLAQKREDDSQARYNIVM